jgi:uncharacterized membrane protein YedE/YeeE
MFEQMGFSTLDGFAFVTAIIVGILGAGLDYARRDLPRMDWHEKLGLFSGGIIFIGAFAGAIVWLLMYGSLRPTPSAFCALFLLCGWAGLAAPKPTPRTSNIELPARL